MQRFIHCRVVTTIIVLPLCLGCAPREVEEKAGVAPTTSALGLVEATTYPLAYMVERVTAPLAEVSFRAGAAADPAYWKPTPEDITAMQRADLIVLNGASYESWLKSVSLPPSRLVDTSAGLGDRLIPLSEALTHSHGVEGAHEHKGTAFTTWLDPTLAAEQAGALTEALATRWSEQRSLFEDQFADLEADLLDLDAELARAVASAPGQPVVFSHPVYQYLEQRYGLNGRSLHWEPDTPPDEVAWAELETLLQTHPAKWMIWEAEPLPEVSERLAGLGVGSVVVAPCAHRPAEGDFLDTMRHNVEALRRVYAAEPGTGG